MTSRFTYDGADAARPCATSTCASRSPSWCSSPGAPARGSRRCCAPSTGSCRTSPAATSPATCSSAARQSAAPAPRELADLVGFVGQDPLQHLRHRRRGGRARLRHGAARPRRRRRCGAGSRRPSTCSASPTCGRRSLRTLSGGQQQRVAIGAVLTMHPRVLVLDEPTSALDPTAAEDVLGTLARLVDDLGLTVLLAEHRMERVVPFADRLVRRRGRPGARPATAAEMLETSPVAPPVVELGRLAGWQPLPLSVREARRRTARAAATRLAAGPARAASARPVPTGPSAARRRRGRRGPLRRAPSRCGRCR